MKALLKTGIVATLTVCVWFAGALQGNSQISVGVDPSQTWFGYMNVYNAPSAGGGYLWGSPWGVADLPATFSAATLTLAPNTSSYNPGDAYWVNADGSGNKQMEANVYIESTAMGGNTVTFSGLTLANTLAPGYYAQAFIKEFGPGYSWVGWDFIPLTGGSTFSVSRTIAAGHIAQYGFMTVGVVANPATVGGLGTAVVQLVPEPASLGLLGLGLAGLLAFRRRN